MKGKSFSYDKQYSIDTPVNYAMLTGVSLFFWIAGYAASTGYPVHSEASATPLWQLVCRVLPGKTFTYLAGILLTLGGAFLIYRANYILVIIREKTLMPFFLYLLLISTNPNFFPLKPSSPGVFCLILAFYRLLNSYHDAASVQKTFSAALLIGVGSLLWVHILWFLPVFWLGMYNFKVLSPRTFLASLTGAGLVYWFLLGWCVWQRDFTPFTVPFASMADIGLPGRLWQSPLIHWLPVLCAAFPAMIAIVNILLHEHDDNLRTRRFLSFLILLSAASLGLFLVYRQSSDEFLNVICMPVSILVSHFFTVKKGRKKCLLYYALMLAYISLSFLRSSWIFLSSTVI
ncbi:MAG: hypothetical protein LBP25_00630 [Tannerellaceae bacterium]|jgi:hypothetical protein|nr:hypothetical protein [Tannerellaceae bacterium]